MDAHYALKIVIDHINEIKGLSPAGSKIMLDPWDIADRIPYSYLSLTLEKMEKDHKILDVTNEPVDAPSLLNGL